MLTQATREIILAALAEYEHARSAFWDGEPQAMADAAQARDARAEVLALAQQPPLLTMWTETHVANMLGNNTRPVTYAEAHALAMRILAHHERVARQATEILAREKAQGAWLPVEDGEYSLGLDFDLVRIAYNNDAEANAWITYGESEAMLPAGMAVCQLVPVAADAARGE